MFLLWWAWKSRGKVSAELMGMAAQKHLLVLAAAVSALRAESWGTVSSLLSLQGKKIPREKNTKEKGQFHRKSFLK